MYKIRKDKAVYFMSMNHSYMVIQYENTLHILIEDNYLRILYIYM